MVIQWCQTNNSNTKTYYYWLRKLRTQALAKKELSVLVEVPEQPVAFKQLEVKTLIADTWVAAIIHLPQATLEISEETSQQTIQAVLLALQSVC